jgi:hypothetical protein
MARLLFRATLFLILANVSLPLHAQQGSVALSVCNAGKVAIDVFLAKGSQVASSHIFPADCARVYSENVGLPAYVGFAFVDSHGQWGGAHRLDLLPDFGFRNPAAGPEEILNRADQNVSVRRGNKDVSMPMQLLFQPRNPICQYHHYDSAVARLPWNATAFQRAQAASEDANRPPDKTTCEDLFYTLNALAYPDSREITFNNFCDPCQKKAEARLTPEERAARQQRSDAVNQEVENLKATGPLGALVMGNLEKQAKQQAQEEEREREQERRQQQPESYRRMNWQEMNLALANVRPARGRPPEMPEYLIIRGTVSRVDLSPPGASEH